jgi:nucleoside phosphorylase
LSVKNKKTTYILTGIGAPNVMEAVLALGCTPCKNIIFIGSVGGLDKEQKIGDIIIPEYSLCGDGACRYLTNTKLSENDFFGKNTIQIRNFTKILFQKQKKITEENKGTSKNLLFRDGFLIFLYVAEK